MYRKLILKFVNGESDFIRGYVVVDYNILILSWVDNILVYFLKKLLRKLSVFVVLD